MESVQKKTAPEAGTPETENEKSPDYSIANANGKIKLVVQNPGEISRVVTATNTLEAMQEVIGGYIETVTLPNGLVLVMDEEGRLKGLTENVRCVQYGTIVGTVFITAADGEDFRSLTTEEIQSARVWLIKHSVWEEEK